MFEATPTTVKATVHLKTGEQFEIDLDADRKFSFESLQVGTLQKFINKKKKFFVQGDSISYIEVNT